MAKLAEVDGEVGSAVVAPLGDLGRYIVEFAFGDIYSRKGLELRVHLGAALNVGATPQQLEEVVIQTVPYAGFPTAIHALKALRLLVEERAVKAGRTGAAPVSAVV